MCKVHQLSDALNVDKAHVFHGGREISAASVSLENWAVDASDKGIHPD